MGNSPLFPNFNRFTQAQLKALAEWAAAQGTSGGAGRGGRGRAPRSGRPTQYGRGGRGDWLWQAILSKLGPLGQVVGALLRPRGKPLAPDLQRELAAAQQLLEAFGFTVGRPGTGRGASGSHPLTGELVDEPKPGRPEVRIDTTPRPSRPTGEGGIESPTLPRRRRRTDEPDQSQQDQQTESGPLIEGMIPVKSSNVHSIGYEWNADNRRPGNLLVRFLGGTGSRRGGPGPLYRYKDVPRDVFTAFKIAASKGKFVWDELRIRGTVSGHQYDYDLAGLGADNYVPRQAGLKRGQKGEFYLRRSFQGRRSQLPERQVRGTRQALTPDFRAKAAKVDFRAGRRD